MLRRSWTEDLWSYEGEFITVPPKGLHWPHPMSAKLDAGVVDGVLHQVATVPKPLQTPHPPLFTTLTQSPATIDWAARIGSTIVTIATDYDVVRGIFAQYAQAATAYGRPIRPGQWRPDGGVALCRALSVGRTREEAWTAARQSMAVTADWLGGFGFFEAWRLPGQEGPVPRTLEQMVAAGAMIVGTPDEVGEQVRRLRDDLGVEYLVFAASAGAVDHERMLDTIHLFGEHVIPALNG